MAMKWNTGPALGLIPSADRRDSNYRDYGASEVHRLAFIRRGRDLGFSMDEIRDLLKLWGEDRYFPLVYSRARVEQETEQVLWLRPARR